jgi:hypothetical protein
VHDVIMRLRAVENGPLNDGRKKVHSLTYDTATETCRLSVEWEAKRGPTSTRCRSRTHLRR